MQAILITLVSVLGAGLFGVIAMIYYGFRADLSDLRADISDLRDDNAALRAEFKADNAALRSELKADISDLRDDNAALRAEMAKLVEAVHDLGSKMAVGFADLEMRFNNKIADLEVNFTEKLATGLADLEVRLNNRIAVEISGVRQSTPG